MTARTGTRALLRVSVSNGFTRSVVATTTLRT